MRSRLALIAALAAGLLISSCTGSDEPSTEGVSTTEGQTSESSTTAADVAPLAPPASYRGELTFEVVATYPHLRSSFTQGLEITDDGRLIESVGRFGESGRAVVDLETGEHISFVPLSDDLFGEGMTEIGDKLVQITWLSGTAIVADSATLEETDRFSFNGEGWGICFDGTDLVMSNGSGDLTFRDAETFKPISSITVAADDLTLLGQFNELECVGDQVWANVYFRRHLVAIDPKSGIVQAWVNLESLVPDDLTDNLSVLNGIAYRPSTETFLVTGKNWPEIFELKLRELN